MPLLLDLVVQAATNELKRQGRRHRRDVRLSGSGNVDLPFPVNLHSALAAVLASLSVDLGVDLKELEARAEARAVGAAGQPHDASSSEGALVPEVEELRRVVPKDMDAAPRRRLRRRLLSPRPIHAAGTPRWPSPPSPK